MASSSPIHLPKDHYFLSQGDTIQQLISPLSRFGVKTLTFIRNYHDGSQVYISSNPSWVENYYDMQLYGQFISKPGKTYQQKYLIVPNESSLPVHQLARQKYNEGNTFSLIKQYPNFTEFYFFAGDVNDINLTNLFINHVDLFETFSLYFLDRAEKIIERAEKNKIIIPNRKIVTQKENDVTNLSDINDTLEEIKLRKYKMRSLPIKLSRRQIDCIASYQVGLTAKQAAKVLDISFRTVEDHFDILKDKFECNSKKDIMNILEEDGFPKRLLTKHFFDFK